jgi:hypothetical protein
MAADEQSGGAATGDSAKSSEAAADKGPQPAAIDIQRLAEKVYALFLADARRGQVLGARRSPRGRG